MSKKNVKKKRKTIRGKLLLCVLVVLLIVGGYFGYTKFYSKTTVKAPKVVDEIKSFGYVVNDKDTKLFKTTFNELKKVFSNNPLFDELEENYETGLNLAKLTKEEMRSLRTEIQLIFQDPYSSLPPRMTIGEILTEPVKVHGIVEKDKITEHVRKVMKMCGLQPQYYDRYPHEFSGGQRQRICIARALVVNPKLVICDEPVSALDVSIQAQIINLLKDLQRELGLTYMFISHDLSVVKYITDSIIVMYLGNMMEIGDTKDIFENPLHPYTQALFSAVPVPDPDEKMQRIILKGDIPSPVNPPKGCKFHTRCEKCMSVCKLKAPEFVEHSSGHRVACHLYNEEVMNNLESYDKMLEEVDNHEE
jgi:peptide/nickel transport system ATP-binding protein